MKNSYDEIDKKIDRIRTEAAKLLNGDISRPDILPRICELRGLLFELIVWKQWLGADAICFESGAVAPIYEGRRCDLMKSKCSKDCIFYSHLYTKEEKLT
jgi:hypothetical protein